MFLKQAQSKDENETLKPSKTTKASTTTANSSPPNEDEEKMKKILSTPSIQSTLQSPKIQQLFHKLKTDPVKAQRLAKYFLYLFTIASTVLQNNTTFRFSSLVLWSIRKAIMLFRYMG